LFFISLLRGSQHHGCVSFRPFLGFDDRGAVSPFLFPSGFYLNFLPLRFLRSSLVQPLVSFKSVRRRCDYPFLIVPRR